MCWTIIAVTESILAGVEKGGLVVECISARLMIVRIQLEGKSNDMFFVVGYAPTLGSLAREKDHVWNAFNTWSQGFPVGTIYLSSWMRTPGRANDVAGPLTVRCSVHTGVMN